MGNYVFEGHEVLESVVVEMDPILDGFAGVLVELVVDGERYALVETALGSGNRLLRFGSADRGLVCALFETELSNGSGIRPDRRAGPSPS